MPFVEKKYVLLLIGVFFLALFARVYDAHFTYIFGVDSYWFARMASYVVRFGHLPEYDPLHSFIKPAPIKPSLAPYYEGWLYLLFFGKDYDPYKMMRVAQWLAPIFGAVGAVMIALISGLLFGPVGLLVGGIFGSLVPGYAYRTLAGFYEDDATAAFMFFIFYFIMLAVAAKEKKKYYMYAALSAVFAALSALSWVGSPQAALGLMGTLVLFLVLELRRFIPKISEKYINWAAIGTAAIAVVAAFALHAFVFHKAALELYNTFLYGYGGGGDPRVVTVVRGFIEPFPVEAALFSLFGFFSVLLLEKNDKKYLYASLGCILLGTLILIGHMGQPYTTQGIINGVYQTLTFLPSTQNLSLLFSSLFILIYGGLGALIAVLLFTKGESFEIKDYGVVALAIVAGTVASLTIGYNWLAAALAPIIKLTGSAANPAQGIIAATVGEEVYGFFSWPYKYGILALLAVLSLPVMVWLAGKDKKAAILLPWFALTWYAAWSKLKFAYYFGFTIAYGGTALVVEAVKRIKEKRSVALLIFFILISMFATAAYHEFQHQPSLMTESELNELAKIQSAIKELGGSTAYMPLGGDSYAIIPLAKFIDQNTPKDANIANWWTFGHHLTFLTERRVLADNTNKFGHIVNPLYARIILSPEENAYRIIREINANYLLVTPIPPTATASYARYMFDSLQRYDPRVFDYVGILLQCKALENNTHICGIVVNVGGILRIDPVIKPISEDKWAQIPSFWMPTELAPKVTIDNPNYVISGREYVVYKQGDNLLLVPPKLNDALITKLWFGVAPKYFKIVYAGYGFLLLEPVSSSQAPAS